MGNGGTNQLDAIDVITKGVDQLKAIGDLMGTSELTGELDLMPGTVSSLGWLIRDLSERMGEAASELSCAKREGQR